LERNGNGGVEPWNDGMAIIGSAKARIIVALKRETEVT
jgi:hypothetical protein